MSEQDPRTWESRIFRVQRDRNASTSPLWDAMRPHRLRVTREILRAGMGGRLVVFGAGNCNDLELGELAAAFAEVHLVDLDGEAMDSGVRRQGLCSNERLRLHGGIDFSGLGHALSGDALDTNAFASLVRDGIGRNLAERLPPSDVVVSTCVLSQLIDSVARTAPSDVAAKERAVVVRDQHLDMLIERTLAGGVALLIADLVSSDTAPTLRTCPELALPKLRDELIATHNYFHGTNPYAIEQALARRHPQAISKLERRPPWRWSIGERAFLVTALGMKRA